MNMKIQELRLGNWVLHNNKPIKVESILGDGINVCRHGDAIIAYDGIKPIVLTEEMLLKCGFTSNDNWWFYFNIYPYSYLVIAPKEKCGEIALRLPDNKREYKINEFTNFDSLHQLQNIYFVLTGKELEVEL